MPNRNAQRGYRAEKKVQRAFEDAGYPTERVPLSGAVTGGSFDGDLRVKVGDRDLKVEVKTRKGNHGYQNIVEWLGGNDVLVLNRDGPLTEHPPLVVMPLPMLFSLLNDAALNYHKMPVVVNRPKVVMAAARRCCTICRCPHCHKAAASRAL